MIPLLIYGAAGLIGPSVYIALFGLKYARRLALGPIAGLFIFFLSPEGSALDIIAVILLGFFFCWLLPWIGNRIATLGR